MQTPPLAHGLTLHSDVPETLIDTHFIVRCLTGGDRVTHILHGDVRISSGSRQIANMRRTGKDRYVETLQSVSFVKSKFTKSKFDTRKYISNNKCKYLAL